MIEAGGQWHSRAARPVVACTIAVLAVAVTAAGSWVGIRTEVGRMSHKGHVPLLPVAGSPPGYVPTTRIVRAGTSARLSGARWTLESIRSDVAPRGWDGAPEPVMLPPGTEFLVVRVRIELPATASGKRLSGCTMDLVDRKGRVWESSGASGGLADDACDPEFLEAPSKSWSYQQGFMVPRSVARVVTPLVSTSDSWPDALIFER